MTESGKLTDRQLNKKIVDLVFGYIPKGMFHYTKNWDQLMPLVEKYRLIIVPYKDDLWEAFSESGGFVVYNKSYLRAGAECLYLFLEDRK